MADLDQPQDISPDLQGAIFNKLNKDSILEGMLGGNKIYDYVPDNTPYPYVVIGDDDIDDWNTHTFIGSKGSTIINVWHRSETKDGRLEVKQIMRRIWLLLNNQDLGIASHVQINFRCDNRTIVTQVDGKTLNGVMRFNFIFGG